MRVPAGLKRLDDRVLGAKASRTDGTRTGARRSDGHEDVYPQDKERSVEQTESGSQTTTEPTEPTEPTAERKQPEERTERIERRTRSARDDGKGAGRRGDGLPTFLATVWRISRLVLLALGLLLVLAVALILLPANEDNVIVRNVLDYAQTVAGPFKDVFSVDDPERMRIYNYALAAGVYFLLATVVGRLPTGSRKKSS